MNRLRILIGGGKNRQTNIELARLLSMFLILVIHADMVSLAKPTSIDFANNPISVIARYLFESIGIVSVDVFVMISGWFLVKTKAKGVLSFIYQILFFWGGGYLVMLATNNAEFSIKGVLHCLALTPWDWFIKAYLVLLIIAPILNSFIQNSSEKLQRSIIFWFFLFMCTYGWIGGARRFFVDGYGPLSFIGLYLLSNYVRNINEFDTVPLRVKQLFNFNKSIDLFIFVTSAILNTIIGVVALKLDVSAYRFVYSYINPLVIIGAIYFLLFFSKIEIKQNTLINWLAASSFAVYLLHGQFDIRPFFTKYVQAIYDSYNGVIVIILIGFYLVLVYLLSVMIDQLRIFTWNKLSKKIK